MAGGAEDLGKEAFENVNEFVNRILGGSGEIQWDTSIAVFTNALKELKEKAKEPRSIVTRKWEEFTERGLHPRMFWVATLPDKGDKFKRALQFLKAHSLQASKQDIRKYAATLDEAAREQFLKSVENAPIIIQKEELLKVLEG